MSGLSAFLYVDLMELEKADPSLKSIPNEMKDRYGFRVINSEMYVGAFADIKADKRSMAAEYGVLFNGKRVLPFMTVNIPVRNYVRFLNSGIADYIEIDEKEVPMMDSAKYFTRTDQVHSGYNLPRGYTGKNVVVGIIDIGFHYSHLNFYDSTGNTYRVKRVWDQNDTNGPAPAGFYYGKELTTQSAILAARYSHNDQTHGSHVAGMAAGGGTNDSLMKKYKGMAPESDIVLVATTMYSSEIFDGLQYILDYAESVGKPCVVNMSLGNHSGPHDGTDYNEYATDYLFDSIYTKGAALMVSAGNEGDDPIHLSKTFTSQDTSIRTFAVKSNGSNKLSSTVDIWGEVGHNFTVKIAVVDSTSTSATLDTLSYPVTLTTIDTIDWTTYVNLSDNAYVNYYVEDSNYYNNKPHVYLQLRGGSLPTGRKSLIIRIEATSGTVHMWNNSGIFIGGTAATAGNTNYTSNNRASGRASTMVASYNSKCSWTTYVEDYYNLHSRYTIGGRSYFSSIGPGLNPNLNKPEITGPGALVRSSYNYYDYRYDESNYMITDVQVSGGDTFYWGMMQGTSMSCPAVTGIVALWMEACPELTYAQVKELMRTTAITDTLTGNIPANGSPQWGWGKINAYGGIQTILSRIPRKPVLSPAADTTICADESITISAPAGYLHYQWNTGDTTRTITTSTPGSFLVRVDSVGGYFSPWSDTITISVKRRVTPTISNDTTVCPGQLVTITAGGGDSYFWYAPYTGRHDTTASVTFEPILSWHPCVVRIDSTGLCPAFDSMNVFLYNVPHVEIRDQTGQVADCDRRTLQVPHSTATLTVANTFQTYLWSTGDTSRSITVSPTEPTRYSVVVTTENGCVDSLWIMVECTGVSITSAEGLQFRVYPNPVSPKSKLMVEGSDIETITVYNMLGKEVTKISADGEKSVAISVKDYAQGVYVISVTDTKGQTGRSTFIVK